MADMPRRGFTLPLHTSTTSLGPAVHSDPESGRVCVWVHWSRFTGNRALLSLSLSRRGFSHCSAINQYLISAVKQATLVTTARLEICVSHEGQLTTHHWSPAHHLAFFLSCSTRRVLFTNPIPAQRDYFKILRQATRLKLLLGLSLPQHHDSSPST